MNTIFADELSQPEGPVYLPDGRIALVEMGRDRRSVTIASPGGLRQCIRAHFGSPNGLAIDGDRCLWVAGGPSQSLVRMSMAGEILLQVEGDGHRNFLFPNDVAFGPDGLIYLTDSGIAPVIVSSKERRSKGFADIDYDGAVYRIDPRTGKVITKVATGIKFTNGVAFGVDGALYYNETVTGAVYRVDENDRSELYANVLTSYDPMEFKGPDGMAFADDGTLYCTVLGVGHLCVIAPDSSVKSRILTNGAYPTNVAFALSDKRIFVTELQHGAIEVLPVEHGGLPLHSPKLGL